MQNFRFKITHDNGTFKMKVTARNEKVARHMVMGAEGCPDCAITKL